LKGFFDTQNIVVLDRPKPGRRNLQTKESYCPAICEMMNITKATLICLYQRRTGKQNGETGTFRTNVPASPYTSKQLGETELQNVVNWFFTLENLRSANTKMVDFLASMELPNMDQREQSCKIAPQGLFLSLIFLFISACQSA
jgi:hypothetical protein